MSHLLLGSPHPEDGLLVRTHNIHIVHVTQRELLSLSLQYQTMRVQTPLNCLNFSSALPLQPLPILLSPL